MTVRKKILQLVPTEAQTLYYVFPDSVVVYHLLDNRLLWDGTKAQ